MINSRERALASFYLDAKKDLIRAGFDQEIEWQFTLRFEEVSEPEFLREAAWVVFSAGFRESILRAKFDQISMSFLGWKSAKAIHEQRKKCRRAALSVFNNSRKVNAVLKIARFVALSGFSDCKAAIEQQGVEFLMQLPYIGKVTAYHLAKNIGLNVAKPDRHLVRAAHAAGFQTVMDFCSAIHRVVGDPIAVIDLVIWRYATINRKFVRELGHALSVE